jgi:hypothetical protein
MRNFGGFPAESTSGNIFYSMNGLRELDVVIGKSKSLKAGAVLGKKVDGKYYPYKAGTTDGTQNVEAILGIDTDATAADEKAFVYVAGTFNLSQLSLEAGEALTVGGYKNDTILIKEAK